VDQQTPDGATPMAAALAALMPAVDRLTAAEETETAAEEMAFLPEAVSRGYFRPEEEASLFHWFARFLSVREALWEVVEEATAAVGGKVEMVATLEQWRRFVLGYGAACCLVRLDFFLVRERARDRMVRRKLNEGAAEYRIPRKQFSAIFRSLASPRKALAIHRAMRWAKTHRSRLVTLQEDPEVGFVARELERLEEVLVPSKRAYLRRFLEYREHSLRRRGASGREQTTFAVLETSGRAVAEVRNRWRAGRVTPALQTQLAALLEPGDVVVTRREQAFSNLFLPGYWPHAALYIGSAADRAALGVGVDPDRARRWSAEVRFLEALKDGVRFRPVEETLSVDAVAVLRPRLDPTHKAEAIARAVSHEGKLYNFDFDFFRSDRVVCTEVIYRGFDGVGPIQLRLTRRSGRLTLSAEDLLDLALEDRCFRVVAVCGAPACPDRVVTGAEAVAALRR